MQQHGNTTTFNLESVLTQNVINSDYFRRQCVDLKTWEEVVDEIYDNVTDVEPWMSGNARGPSSAFCLLYRMAQIKPTVQEISETIRCTDSPFIRAVGFLYLRYVCDPKNLWSWCEPYVNDQEAFSPSGTSQTVTMGDFVRDILLEQNYFETIFPRIPKKVLDDVASALRTKGLPDKPKGNAGQGGPDRRGSDEPNRRPASVKASLSVAFGQRAPNRAGTKEVMRSRDTTASHERRTSPERRDRDKERDKDRSRYGSDRADRERDRYRNGERDRYRQRSRSRERRRSPSMERDRRERDRDVRRERERSRERHQRRSSSRERQRERSRSREHSRGGREARDVFRDSAAAAVDASAGDIKARYGDASGKLFENRGSRGRERADEVYRLGSKYGW